MSAAHPFTERIQDEYRRRTAGSAAAFERASRSIPGGISRSGINFAPYPLAFAHGSGCRVTDVDGNEYIDFLNNHSSLVHGHAHPQITEAIRQQAERGTAWSAIAEEEAAMAETVCQRVASLEQVRFCNSGTEAGMQALRIVRAATGRDKVLKFEGGMHGSQEDFEVSKRFDPSLAGPPSAPVSMSGSGGFSAGTLERVVTAPYNDGDVAAQLIREHRDELAAVFVEPIMGFAGQIPAEPGFLPFLREVTRENGVPLIVDEVVSFRLAVGGAQSLEGIAPDLTMLGKIIGGGLPAGAVGGRADLMRLSSYADGADEPRLGLSGTFSGSAVVMAAGQATLQLLNDAAIERLNRLGDRMRQGLRTAIAEEGVRAQVTGAGSLLNIHFTAEPVRDYRAVARASAKAMAALHLCLVDRGIYPSPQGWFNLSTPMTQADIDEAIDAVRDSLRRMRRYLSEITPELVIQ